MLDVRVNYTVKRLSINTLTCIKTFQEAEIRRGYIIIEHAAGLFTTLGEKPRKKHEDSN